MRRATAERAVNAYYDSESALRMVASELGALGLVTETEVALAEPARPGPEPSDAEAGLMAAFDRALAILVPGYPRHDEEACDHLVVRRALEFEVSAIVTAVTNDVPATRGIVPSLRS